MKPGRRERRTCPRCHRQIAVTGDALGGSPQLTPHTKRPGVWCVAPGQVLAGRDDQQGRLT